MFPTPACLWAVPGKVKSDLAVHGDSTLSLRATRAGNGPGLSRVAWRLVPADRAAEEGWEVSSAVVQLVSVEWVLSPPGMPASPDERRQASTGPC